MGRSSRIKSFYKLDIDEKLKVVKDFASLSDEEILMLKTGKPDMESVERMVENVIGVIGMPFGIATNFLVNGKDYLVPMVTEESSVIAAASNGAKMVRAKGGFTTSSTGSFMAVQIQVDNTSDPESASREIIKQKQELLEMANTQSTTLPKLNAGAKDIKVDIVNGWYGPMVIVRLIVDVCDAMGANVTNTMCEAVAPMIEKLSGGKTLLRILSNYSTKRMVRVSAVFDKDEIGGEGVVDDMISAFQFADNDTYRAVTHNKGVMNGVIAVANATGQDSRAIEAAAHAYASKTGSYRSLTKWEKDANGNLVGNFELPLSVGIVGGVIQHHPIAKICTKILGVSTAQELSCVIAVVGLAQNFSAMRALATEGIQKGHMKLHARKENQNS